MNANKLNQKKLEIFDKECAKIRNDSKNNHLRTGQIMVIVLTRLHPELAREINEIDIDPFYDDRKIKSFIDYISENP